MLICFGNGDMLIGVFNLVNIIYLIIIDFDGVGVFGVVNVIF